MSRATAPVPPWDGCSWLRWPCGTRIMIRLSLPSPALRRYTAVSTSIRSTISCSATRILPSQYSRYSTHTLPAVSTTRRTLQPYACLIPRLPARPYTTVWRYLYSARMPQPGRLCSRLLISPARWCMKARSTSVMQSISSTQATKDRNSPPQATRPLVRNSGARVCRVLTIPTITRCSAMPMPCWWRPSATAWRRPMPTRL